MTARRKKKEIYVPPTVIRIFLIVFFASIIGFASFKGVSAFLRESSYFKIKVIQYNESLSFINKRDLAQLKGENIFSVDLKAISQKLQRKYPRITQLRVMRRFPDQLIISARERHPFIQVAFGKKFLILDFQGVILSINKQQNKKLPVLTGMKLGRHKPILGVPFKGRNISIALRMVEAFQTERTLRHYHIRSINMKNLSKIVITLSNKLDVIFDRDKIDLKVKKLGIVLTQLNLNVKEIKYIDMRFKEPIVKKK